MIDRQQQDFEFLSVPSEQWLSARIYPRDDGGLSVFVQDISRRRQAEERLRASEAHFHAVANLGPDLLWQNKPDGTVTWSNERSEEHTSELQSLMRISYAVFFLKKNKKQNHTRYKTQ